MNLAVKGRSWLPGSGSTPSTTPTVQHPSEEIVAKRGPFITDNSFLKKPYWIVVDPMILNDALPREFDRKKEEKQSIPHKSSFEIFDCSKRAAAYAQRLNRPLIIMQMMPEMTVTPQLPVVESIPADSK